MPKPFPSREPRYDYKISVQPYGRFFDRWFWKVDHVGGMALMGAAGFTMTEARAIKKADRCAQHIIKRHKQAELRRTIKR